MRSIHPSLLFAGLIVSLTGAAPAGASVSASAPQAKLSTFLEGGQVYTVVGRAKTEQSHTRSEGSLNISCDGASPRRINFTKDYTAARTSFASPTFEVALPIGYGCTLTMSWLIAGGGNIGEAGTSPPTTIDTTGVKLDSLFDDDTKASAKSARDMFRRIAAKNYALAEVTTTFTGHTALGALESALGGVAARIAKDPPDKRFRTSVKRKRVAPKPITDAGSAGPAFQSYLSAAADAAASGIALTTAIDRAQGAKISKRKDRTRHRKAQMVSAAVFGARLARELKVLRGARSSLATALRACACPLGAATVDPAAWTDIRDGLVFNGAPPAFTAELKRFGLQPDLVSSAGADLSSVDILRPGTLADDLGDPQALNLFGLLSTALRKWAAAVKRKPLAVPSG